jgi:uncharacterized protein involved in exopolysaccharide biosynthesis
VLNRLDHIDQRLETLEQNTAAEFKAVREEIAQGRQETAAEFKAVRGEMAQGLDAVRGEMAQGFDSLRHEFKTELQKEFENYGAKTFPIYARLESKTNALEERFNTFNQQFTGMEVMGKNYEQFMRDRDIIDAEHQDLKKDVDTLKKRDMEKAAAIDKIEREIEKLKAA